MQPFSSMAEDQPGLSDGEEVVDEVVDAPVLLLASEGFWAELRGQTPGTQVSFRRPYHLKLFVKQYYSQPISEFSWTGTTSSLPRECTGKYCISRFTPLGEFQETILYTIHINVFLSDPGIPGVRSMGPSLSH